MLRLTGACICRSESYVAHSSWKTYAQITYSKSWLLGGGGGCKKKGGNWNFNQKNKYKDSSLILQPCVTAGEKPVCNVLYLIVPSGLWFIRIKQFNQNFLSDFHIKWFLITQVIFNMMEFKDNSHFLLTKMYPLTMINLCFLKVFNFVKIESVNKSIFYVFLRNIVIVK